MAFTVTSDEQNFLKEFSGQQETEVEFRFGQFISNTKGQGQHLREHFRPGVSRAVFKQLLSYLMTAEGFTTGQNPIDILKVYFPSGVYCELEGKDALNSYTESHQIGEDAIFKRKEKHHDISNLEYAYRIAAARETNLNPANTKKTHELLQNQPPLTFRHLQRYSFASNGFRLDLSVSRTSVKPAISLAKSDLGTRFPAYEVEIELDVGRIADSDLLKRVYRSVQLVLCYIQDTYFPISRSQEDAAVQAYVAAFLLRDRKRTLFLGVDVISLSISNILPPDAAPSTINICRESPEDYTVTVKADGERCLLFVDPKGTVFMINRKLQARRTGLVSPDLANTLIDAEFIQNLNLFLAFDLLFLRGADIRKRVMFRNPDERGNVKGRIEELEDICQKPLWKKQNDRSVGIRTKAYFTLARRNMTDILSKSHELWQSRSQLKYHADGLIFTPRAHPYPDVETSGSRWDRLLKWKPRQLLSIDFQVQVRKSLGQQHQIKYEAQKYSGGERLIAYKVVDLYVGEFKKPEGYIKVPFETGPEMPEYRKEPCYIARILIDENGLMMATDPLSGAKEEVIDQDIVEFTYDANARLGFEWVPIRVRGDKISPNRKDVAANVWEAMHFAKGLIANENLFELANDPLNRKIIDSAWQQSGNKYYAVDETQDERSSSNIIAMRDFHNNVKRALYMAASKGAMESAASDSISALLDLGAGRGGDYSKYRAARIVTVVAVDVDKPGLERLLTKIHQPNEGSNKYPKYIKTIHADMTKLLSNGSAGLSEYDSKKLNDDVYRRYGLEHFPIVSSQFSLHFAFETPRKMQAMLLNVFQNLQVGGYFIGCVLDGQTVFNLLKKNSQLTFEKGDQIYASISKKYSGSKLKATGMAIDVMITSIGPDANREYLVDFATLKDVMQSHLDLVIVDDEQAQQLGLPSGTGMFEGLDGFLETRTKLTDAERRYSYLNRYFIFQKRGVGNAAILKKWLSVM